ncbi:beta-defensin 129 [Perognathus longimembris pacificus]|uniref:beta-defensin 129 n=1 Tax=Perognathus longimembris pacificus TaxID=214514 RepID=UPI00201990CE|nr:beta-defensin 129 [Perognathus longimembris pacificus]
MKLLFPIFASLMLQYQVNSEFLFRKCLMGFGKCKSDCRSDEKEIKKCKKKKCCVGPKVIELIRNYLQHEIPHLPDENLAEMLRNENNFSVLMQKSDQSPVLSKMKTASSFYNTNSAIIPKASQEKLGGSSSNKAPRRKTSTATLSRRVTKQSSKPASASSPPPLP